MSSTPTPYTRQFDFEDFSASNPNSQQPGVQLDAEFDAVKRAIDQTQSRLGEIQREDGELRNLSVHPDALSAATRALMVTDWTPRGAWGTGAIYDVKDVVSHGGYSYICALAHTAGDFATDLGDGKWLLMGAVQEASDVPFTPTDGIEADNVQGAIAELEAEVQGAILELEADTKSELNKRVLIFDTIADLRGATTAETRMAVVKGYHAPGDGTPGNFWADTSDVSSPDDGGRVIVAADGTRWKRLTPGNRPPTAKEYGATADGTKRPMSEFFDTLEAAQAIYPTCGSLDESIDGVVLQHMLDMRERLILLDYGIFCPSKTIDLSADWPAQVVVRGMGGDFTRPATQIRVTSEDFGDKDPVFVCNTTGDEIQHVTFEGIHIRGDLDISTTNLSTAPDEGMWGVDVTGVKTQCNFVDMSFRQLARGIIGDPVRGQLEGLYTDTIRVERCRFSLCWRAIETESTGPLVVTQSTIENCCDWIQGHTGNMLIIGNMIQNSAYAGDRCGIKGKDVRVIGNWFEGGNNQVDCDDYEDGAIMGFGNHFGLPNGSSGSVETHVRFGLKASVCLIGNYFRARIASWNSAYNSDPTLWENLSWVFLANETSLVWDFTGSTNLEPGGVAAEGATRATAAFTIFDKHGQPGGRTGPGRITRARLLDTEAQSFRPYKAPVLSGIRLFDKNVFTLTWESATESFRYLKIILTGTNGNLSSAVYYNEFVLSKADSSSVYDITSLNSTDYWVLTLSDVTSTGATLTVTPADSSVRSNEDQSQDMIWFGERGSRFGDDWITIS